MSPDPGCTISYDSRKGEETNERYDVREFEWVLEWNAIGMDVNTTGLGEGNTYAAPNNDRKVIKSKVILFLVFFL